jgi:hypothetical protein
MYYIAIWFFLPIINAVIVVQIHPNSFYNPNSSCSFLRNALLSNDASIQSCIWECVHEYDCQTAIYFHNNKTCSMFSEVCPTGRIESSGNDPASVICYRKTHRKFPFCLHDAEAIFLFYCRTCYYMFDYFNSEPKTRGRNLNFRCANQYCSGYVHHLINGSKSVARNWHPFVLPLFIPEESILINVRVITADYLNCYRFLKLLLFMLTIQRGLM